MKEAKVLFQPNNSNKNAPSLLCGVALFARSLGLCGRYLAHMSISKNPRQVTDDYINKFWRLQFAMTQTKLLVSGRENLDPKQAYVFMSNHGSWMDIPAMFGASPPSLRMIAKSSLFKIPIFGRALALGGFICIDRQNRSRAIKQLEQAKKRLHEGISVWIAPEGTRSRTGQIGKFKKGGFHLACELGIPIVPVYISGASGVIPPDSAWVYPNKTINVSFEPPIFTQNFTKKDINSLVEQVRKIIINKHDITKKDHGE